MERQRTPLFSRLDATGRFYRDSAIGRIFHPGTVSYREIAETDSVHVTVTPENHVDVHVDGLSPLEVRGDGPCRYSFTRAMAHNAVFVRDAFTRLVRRQRGQQRCHLDCEVVWVPDDDEPTETPVV